CRGDNRLKAPGQSRGRTRRSPDSGSWRRKSGGRRYRSFLRRRRTPRHTRYPAPRALGTLCWTKAKTSLSCSQFRRPSSAFHRKLSSEFAFLSSPGGEMDDELKKGWEQLEEGLTKAMSRLQEAIEKAKKEMPDA